MRRLTSFENLENRGGIPRPRRIGYQDHENGGKGRYRRDPKVGPGVEARNEGVPGRE